MNTGHQLSSNGAARPSVPFQPTSTKIHTAPSQVKTATGARKIKLIGPKK